MSRWTGGLLDLRVDCNQLGELLGCDAASACATSPYPPSSASDSSPSNQSYAAVLAAVQPGIDAAALILGGQVSAEELEALIEQLEDQLPEASYDTVGFGWSTDDDGPLVATAYHFDSEDAAEDSLDTLRELYESSTSAQSQRPFSDYLEVEGVETEGSVVVVTSRPAEGAAIGFAYQALVSRDLLFVSQ